MSDPVAAKSAFLCMYMSNHPDTLVSYVRHWGKIKEKVTNAQMTGIDTKGMTLTYTVGASKDVKKTVRVVFNPPLSGYDEVKPRLMNMKVDAEEALGMAKAPQLSTFHITPRVFQTGVMIAALVYTTFSPAPTSPSYHPAYTVASWVQNALPDGVLKACWIFMVTVHVLESFYTLSLCRKHRTPFLVGTGYVIGTLVFGYPIWTEMRRRVQAARIDSIMKGQ
ncbi:hypothetical protein NLI96_g3902 [Meripilus lineatus]|uniref:DUF2470 domain-containing protein n=1 Tax=Meripilus lineatus TaxID=2056292 RepID=A0AAD5V811_9APHY|nr:hypothetical protein NLI96_g3902 [Physisporinus lineatus]